MARNQVRSGDALRQPYRPVPSGPDQRSTVGNHECCAGVDLLKVGILLRQHRIMGVGRDEEGGQASLDQSRDGRDRLGQAHGRKRQSPDPNGLNGKILILDVITWHSGLDLVVGLLGKNSENRSVDALGWVLAIVDQP